MGHRRSPVAPGALLLSALTALGPARAAGAPECREAPARSEVLVGLGARGELVLASGARAVLDGIHWPEPGEAAAAAEAWLQHYRGRGLRLVARGEIDRWGRVHVDASLEPAAASDSPAEADIPDLAAGLVGAGLVPVDAGERDTLCRPGLLAVEAGAAAEPAPRPGPARGALTLHGLRLRTPDGRDLGPAPDLAVLPGTPLALVGASGCGKTTLLKALAGWSADEPGETIRLAGTARPAAERRALTHLGLHDAAILSDTVRENLFAPGTSDADLWAALEAVELDARIHTGGGLDAWIAEGSLSLGEAQRLNLARALLSPAPVILLDEPAEHLGDDQAARILGRLLARWRDRVVVLTSHRPDLRLPGRRVSLGPD